MRLHKTNPVDSMENLRQRVNRLFKVPTARSAGRSQLSLNVPLTFDAATAIEYPSKSIAQFLDFIVDALPDGEVYLFGGVIRDMALLGRSGFNSDVDLVVDGDWENFLSYLEALGAKKNKFGGYRFIVAGWPVDIWNARETWAIRQGLVSYKGISSLTQTTVLNWDAILMNWRTRSFVCQENYLKDINQRALDIVLEENPNPLGMVVRVFRHLFLKDAKKITPAAARYLAKCANIYDFENIKESEIRSYGNSVIKPVAYKFFRELGSREELELGQGYSIAIKIIQNELGLG